MADRSRYFPARTVSRQPLLSVRFALCPDERPPCSLARRTRIHSSIDDHPIGQTSSMQFTPLANRVPHFCSIPRPCLAPQLRTYLAPISHLSRTYLAPISHLSRTYLAPVSHLSRTCVPHLRFILCLTSVLRAYVLHLSYPPYRTVTITSQHPVSMLPPHRLLYCFVAISYAVLRLD